MRAVLDSNVFASALIRPEGPPGVILRHGLVGARFDLVMSPAILDEIGRCIRYPRVRKRIPASDEALELWLASLELLAIPVPGHLRVEAGKEDPDDDKYLSAALEGLAQYVVTGDAHLLGMRTFEGVEIVRPRDFLGILGT